MSAPIECTVVHPEKMTDKDEDKAVLNDDEVQGDGTNEEGSSETVTVSKSQLKKMKKKEKWEQVKAQKRKAEKERSKARKRECRERGDELPPTRKQLRHNKMSKSSCNIKVVVDCDFDDFMAEKDIKMLVKQIQYSYSANRRAENPLQFYCCGVNGKTKERLENIGDYKGWDVRFHSERFTEMFEKSSIVYLSSESPNVLESLEDDKAYVIGGLVDHNHHKGLCHKLAEEKGLAHAQLPISDYIDMKTRKVLTVNHVFEILLHYTETKDWQKAFYTVLPQRKGAVPKIQKQSDVVHKNTEVDKTDTDINTDKQSEKDILHSEGSLESNSVSDNSTPCDSREVSASKNGTVDLDLGDKLQESFEGKSELIIKEVDQQSDKTDATDKERTEK